MNAHLVEAVSTFVKAQGGTWTGTATDLLLLLSPYARAEGVDTNSKPWPQSPRLLSHLLKKHRKALAAAGISVTDTRAARQRTITISLVKPVSQRSTDWLDDAANYEVDRSTRARVLYARKQRTQIKADADAEKERKLHGGFVVRGPRASRPPWADDAPW